MKVIYIAGPFAGQTQENTRRANHISRLATRNGYAPIAPHSGILLGAYGKDEIPEEREMGSRATLGILKAVAEMSESELWIILDDENKMSPGTKLENETWKQVKKEHKLYTYYRTYQEWVSYLEMLSKVDRVTGKKEILGEDIEFLADWIFEESSSLDKNL
jgi:hypothetical protein